MKNLADYNWRNCCFSFKHKERSIRALAFTSVQLFLEENFPHGSVGPSDRWALFEQSWIFQVFLAKYTALSCWCSWYTVIYPCTSSSFSFFSRQGAKSPVSSSHLSLKIKPLPTSLVRFDIIENNIFFNNVFLYSCTYFISMIFVSTKHMEERMPYTLGW